MMFFVWDGNHRLQAWLPYIDWMHKTKENWHVAIDSIILNNIRGDCEIVNIRDKLQQVSFEFV
jgi:hypothetical protein